MTYHKPYPEFQLGDYVFTADKKKLDLDYLYNLLCIPSRYSTGLPPERFPLIIENSVCFAALYQGKQVGFSRVVTDFSEFASLWDVFIDDAHRGKGVGKTLMKYVLEHPRLRGVFRWFLMTEDAHGLYEKYGFRAEPYNPYVMMKTGLP